MESENRGPEVPIFHKIAYKNLSSVLSHTFGKKVALQLHRRNQFNFEFSEQVDEKNVAVKGPFLCVNRV